MASTRNRPLIIFLSLTALVLVLAGTSVYFYQRYHRLSRNPAASSQAETNDLVAAVGKIAVLPEGETPTIATVTDPEKLSSQAFFADATKGDKVLIYSDAKKAILYDPMTHKIVNMSTLSIGTNNPGTTTETPAPASKTGR